MSIKRTLFLFILLIATGSASQAQKGTTKEVQYLSGTDNRNTVTWDFWCTGGRKSGSWATIQVPSHWEQQGFGAYNYGREKLSLCG